MKKLMLAAALIIGLAALSSAHAALLAGSTSISNGGSTSLNYTFESWGSQDVDVGVTATLYRQTENGLEWVASASWKAQFFWGNIHFPYTETSSIDPGIGVVVNSDGYSSSGSFDFSNLPEGDYRMDVEFVQYGGYGSCEPASGGYEWPYECYRPLNYYTYDSWGYPVYAGGAGCWANWW